MTTSVHLAEAIYEAVVQDDPLPYGGTWRGADRIRAFLEAHDAAEEIVTFEPTEMIPSGDDVVVLGVFEGRAKAAMTPWSTNFVHVLRFRAGLLARWESYFDTSAAIEARQGP